MRNTIKKPRTRNKFGQFQAITIPVDQIIRLYCAGRSENKIAQDFGIDRGTIRKLLIFAGIHIRNRSEAEKNKWENMSQSERKIRLEVLHNARKGYRVSWATKCKHAQTVEKNPSNYSNHELVLQKMLFDRGIETIHQKAIGAYNCDLAAYPVIVEINGGNWHSAGNHATRFEKRTRYILNAGWHVYIIPVTRSFPLTDAVADHLASYIQQARRNKSLIREYRMVWAAGKFTVTGGLKDDNFTIIPPFTNTRDLSSGRYKRIPR